MDDNEIVSNTAEHQPLSPFFRKFYTADGFQQQIFTRARQRSNVSLSPMREKDKIQIIL